MKRSFVYRFIFLMCIFSTVVTPEMTLAKPFTVGVIGEEPAEDIRKTLPLATYLGKQLQQEGFTQGKVLVAKSMNEMASMLRDGTGLGLVICKMIVEAHGGKIWVMSDEGKGSTFSLSLPVNAPSIPAPSAFKAVADRPAGQEKGTDYKDGPRGRDA